MRLYESQSQSKVEDRTDHPLQVVVEGEVPVPIPVVDQIRGPKPRLTGL